MPRRNRVNPFGEIIAVAARGTLMGNRGCLHDANGNVTKRSARMAWVTCVLAFKGRKRTVMTPGQYTELFFLDEATALAAGHRPCATCQRARYDEFKSLWTRANPGTAGSIEDIDSCLQRERVASKGAAARCTSRLSDVPEGALVTKESNPSAALLHWRGQLHPWTPDGYLSAVPARNDETVSLITPPSVCRVLSAGFVTRIHPSAGQLCP